MLPLRTDTSTQHYANNSCNDNSQPFQQQRIVSSNPATYSQKPTIAFEKVYKYRKNIMYLCYSRIYTIFKSWWVKWSNRHTIVESPLSAGETGKLWKDSKLSEIYKKKGSQLMNKETKWPNEITYRDELLEQKKKWECKRINPQWFKVLQLNKMFHYQ